MSVAELPLARIFWSILLLEVGGLVMLLGSALFAGGGRGAPDGGLVGAWIILIPVAWIALAAAVFVVTSTPWVQVGCILMLALPVIAPVVASPVVLVTHFFGEKIQNRQNEIGRRGGYLFHEAGQKKLAAAIVERNLTAMEQALPEAGDLNRQYKSGDNEPETMLSFALDEADNSDAYAAVLQRLLKAGANPNLPPRMPLAKAIMRSKRATAILVEAGADVNALSNQGDPVWWLALEQGEMGSPDTTLLELLLKHGADVTKGSTKEWGPIHLAVAHEKWTALLLLAERVPGLQDLTMGPNRETILMRLESELKSLRDEGKQIPEALLEAIEKFGGAKRSQ
jgi:hypothetical protein